MKNLVGIGIFFIFLGFILVAASSLFQQTGTSGTGNAKIAWGGFIGPIPFGWANDKRLFYPLMGFFTLMMMLWIVWQLMQR